MKQSCLILCLALAAAPATAIQPESVAPGVYPISGSSPALPHEELLPLQKIVGNARFVGLGEAIHTSGGFFEMKDRLFRFLVQEMGFRALGFESAWIRADRVETYVQTCQGTPEQALTGLYGVWQSAELASLVQWMCEWNQAHPDDRVHFYGFDIQAQDFRSADALLAFLARIGVGGDDPRVRGIRACDGVEEFYFPEIPFPDELYQQCQGALSAVEALFDGEERDIVRQTSAEDLGWARVHLTGLQRSQEQTFYAFTDFFRSYAARDRGMATVAQAIRDLRFPHARVALWGHNSHVMRSDPATGFLTFGTFLDQDLGKSYANLGLTAFDTRVDWIYTGLCGPFNLVTPDSAELALHDLGVGVGALVDLDPRGSHPSFFAPGLSYSVGLTPMVPAAAYDGLVYLEVSPKMTPLLWAPCQE